MQHMYTHGHTKHAHTQILILYHDRDVPTLTGDILILCTCTVVGN